MHRRVSPLWLTGYSCGADRLAGREAESEAGWVVDTDTL